MFLLGIDFEPVKNVYLSINAYIYISVQIYVRVWKFQLPDVSEV